MQTLLIEAKYITPGTNIARHGTVRSVEPYAKDQVRIMFIGNSVGHIFYQNNKLETFKL